MRKEKRFFVVCDFLPPDAAVSLDPRVHRIVRSDYDSTFKKHGYGGNDYLIIKLLEESNEHYTFGVMNAYGYLAGHVYSFVFRRTDDGLEAEGELLCIS